VGSGYGLLVELAFAAQVWGVAAMLRGEGPSALGYRPLATAAVASAALVLLLAARESAIERHDEPRSQRLRAHADGLRVCSALGFLAWLAPSTGVIAACLACLGLANAWLATRRYRRWLRREGSVRARRSRLLTAMFAAAPELRGRPEWTARLSRARRHAALQERVSERRLRAGLGFDLAREGCSGLLAGCAAVHGLAASARFEIGSALVVLWLSYAAADALRDLSGRMLALAAHRS
jgi:hypothetical protein